MDKYFFLNSKNEQSGPVSPTEFGVYGITASTMVWKQGMQNWMQAGQIPELSQYISSSLPPTPPTPPSYGGSAYSGRSNMSGNYGGGGINKPLKPSSHMVWAILTTLFCCLPVGVYSIVLSSKVDSLYNMGDYAGAQEKSNEARNWILVGSIGGFVVQVIAVVLAKAS